MGSEAIHYEALRKQIINDRRTANQVHREPIIPPYQPSYSTIELPKDDAYGKIVKQEGDYTVVQYFIKKDKHTHQQQQNERILITQVNGKFQIKSNNNSL